jgi:hypothetical protein
LHARFIAVLIKNMKIFPHNKNKIGKNLKINIIEGIQKVWKKGRWETGILLTFAPARLMPGRQLAFVNVGITGFEPVTPTLSR